MSQKKLLFIIGFIFSFIVSPLVAQGQEICDNGLDDDHDGFVDCYDTDCVESAACEGAFVEDDPTCEVVPSQFPTFSLNQNYASPSGTSSNNGLSAIGDLDGDGINEIVTTNNGTDMIYVLDGRDGSIKYSRDVGSSPSMEAMIGDVDDNGFAEIFIPFGNTIRAYNYDLSEELWDEPTTASPGNMGLADFDEDGRVELYARDQIFDALTGDLLHGSAYNSDDIKRNITLGPIAVDILDDSECTNCAGLELIAGGLIYSVDIDRGANTASLNLEKSIANYEPQYSTGLRMNRTGTSVADYNQDGYLDVLTSGNTTDREAVTKAFFWDVKNNIVKTYYDPNYFPPDGGWAWYPSSDGEPGWEKGTGRLNVADIDGDGKLNVTYVTGTRLYALDENFDLQWYMPINETSSGTTGTTVFDFNGDGKFEIVYRDEQNLYIIADSTKADDSHMGVIKTSIPCASLTYTEYPIVADVNSDGATEICVSCLTNDYGDIYDIEDSEIRVYGSGGEDWVPARKVWNQHGYFNVNVNDDLTIPREMQDHHKVFSTGVCSDGDHQPLNTFLNQAPYLTSAGCANYSAPDIGLSGEIEVNEPHCPETQFTISFAIHNEGDREVAADVPISFYSSDPFTAGAIKLETIKVFLDIPAGETVEVNDLPVPGPGTDFPLYVSLNDAGEQTPPISFPAGGILECDYGDNVHTLPVGIAPAELIVTKLKDNNRCSAGTGTDNGAAQAAVNGPEMIWVEDFEDLWEDEDEDDGSTAWEADDGETHRDNGDMKFRVRDDRATWESEPIDISGYTSADLAVDLYQKGDMEDEDYVDVYYVLDGGSEILFDTNGENNGNFGTSRATVGDLTGNTVRIVIKSRNSNWNEEHYFDNISVKGFGNATAGYTFYWYAGGTASGTPIHTGSVATGLAEGDYAVRAVYEAGCSSDTALVTINRISEIPEIRIDILKSVSNCSEADGVLEAVVEGGVATDYEFVWYDGLDIFTSPQVSNAAIANDLEAKAYTVLVTDKVSGCQTIKTETVPSSVPIPVVSPTVITHVTDCANPASGEASALVNGQGLIWLEDFEDLDERDEDDNGSTAWSSWEDARDAEVDGYWEKRFMVRDGRATWQSEEIDLTGYTAIDVSVDLYEEGNMRDSDYIEVYYVLDGGAETLFPTNGRNEDDFGTRQATANDLSGSTIQIIIKVRNNDNDERHFLDNIKVEGVGNFTTNYIFEWYAGTAIKPSPDFTGSSVTGLEAGDYLVTATSPTGCTSDPVPLIIEYQTAQPVLTATVVSHLTSCDPTSPNGAVKANVEGITTGYTFEWYEGQTTNAGYELTGSPSPALSGLTAGIYTVKVIDDANNCFSTTEVTIEDNRATVTVSANITDQSTCVPANGSLTAVAADGNGTYTYYWFDGEVGTPDPALANFTGATYSNLEAGDYTVLAVDGNTCTSEPKTFTVGDNTVQPVVSADSVNNTSCDPAAPNGSVQANVGGTTTGYSFQWFTGNNTNAANELPGSPAPSISGLGANTYTVLATNEATGCFATTTVNVIDDSEPLGLKLTSTPNNVCDPAKGFTGTITATKSNPNHQTGDTYVYELFDEDGNSLGSPQTNDSTFTALEDGKYLVQVTNTRLGCLSNQISVTVENTQVTPDIAVATIPMTTCSGAAPNGAATASVVGGVTTDYEFAWFTGSATTGTPFATTANVTGLDGTSGSNAYTVVVTNKATGCRHSKPVTITNESVLPTLSLTSTPNSVCDPALGLTGTITASKTDANHQSGDTYTYELFDNTGASLGTQTDSVFTALVDGDYTVTITNNRLGCTSDPEPVTITDDTAEPVISVVKTPMTNCSGIPNGGASAHVGGETADYTFTWYRGNAAASADSLATGTSIANLDGTAGNNTYTVLVTDELTGCFDTQTFTIADDSALPGITLTSTPNSICDPTIGFTGTITATKTDINQQSGDSYVYTLYNSVGDSLTSQADSVFTALEDGDYTVTITNERLGCISDAVAVVVESDQISPDITVNTTPMTTCSGLSNGAASANIAGDTTGYDFEWFEGSGTAGTSLGTYASVSALDGTYGSNTYTVKVTNQATGCFSTETFNIQDQGEIPILTLDNKMPSTVCDASIGFDGSITLNVSHKGNDVTDSSAYVFTWYNGKTATAGNENTGSTNEMLTALDSGFYTVVVVDTILNCTSDPFTVEVLEDKYKPVISFTKLDQTSCNPSAPNGQLISLIDDSAIGETNDPADYSFTWFEGNGTGTPVTAPATQGGVNGEQLDNLAGNLNYTVEVVRDATGCAATGTEFLPETITEPVVQVAENSAITICAGPNGPDGFLRAEADGGAGFTETDYTFHWMVGEATLASEVFAQADSVKDEDGKLFRLFPSKYTVVATNKTTECISAPLTVEVGDDTKDIDIGIAFDFIPTACGENSGAMTAAPSYDGVASPGDFNYKWYVDGPSNDSVNFFTNPPVFDPNTPAATTATHAGLESGIYSIVVEHAATGCKEIKTEFLPFLEAHEVDSTFVNSTICPYDMGNGSVGITITPPATAAGAGVDNSGYEVWVYEGLNDSGTLKVDSLRPAAGTGNITLGSNYAPGSYTIVVQETYTGQDCETVTFVEIGADARAPIVSDNPFANTSCGGPFAFDGSVQLDVKKHPDDITPDNTFTASFIDPVSGSTVSQSGALNPTGDNVTFGSLGPETYEVTVTDDDSKCFTTKEFTILDQPKKAELTLAAADAIFCDPSGSAEVTAIDGGAEEINDYEFTWYTDAAATAVYQGTGAGDNTANNGGDYIDLSAIGTVGGGTFYVVAKKTADTPGTGGLNCESGPVPVIIDDVAENPLVDLTAFSNTSCDPAIGEGKIELIITDPYASTIVGDFDDDFSIDIVGEGNGTSYSPAYASDTIALGGLKKDKYNVTVENDDTGCITTAPISVEKNEQPLIINQVTHKDQELCDPDGQIAVTEITLKGVDNNSDGVDDTDPLSSYEFSWYSDASLSTPVAGAGNAPGLNKREDGDYYVVAKKISGSPGPGSGCESASHHVKLDDISVDPLLAITTDANTACVLTGGGADGAVQIVVTDGGLNPSTGAITSDYTYTWQTTTGTLPADRSNVATTENWTQLAPGKYTLTVESNGSGCTVEAPVTIEDNPVKPVLTGADFTIAHQDLCNPSGSITIKSITPAAGGLGDYTFVWNKELENGGLTPVGDAGTSLNTGNYTNMGAGTYWVEGTKATGSIGPGDGCTSLPFEIQIDDISVSPTLKMTPVANTACDLNGADGQLMVEVTDGGASITDYQYDWSSPAVANRTTPSTNETWTDLKPGTYELTVTSNGTGCTATATKTITSQEVYPEFTTIIDHQDLCDPSGRILVFDTSIGGIGDYTFDWSRETDSGITSIGGVTGVVLNDANYATIGAGTYWVTGTKKIGTIGPGDGCSTTFDAIMDDVSQNPVAQFTDNANHACELAFADGEINVKVTDGSDASNITDFTYWFNTPISGTPDRIAVTDNETWTDLAPGTYTFEIESNGTGCTTSGSVTIADDPALVTVNPEELALTPNFNCDPFQYNGSAIVQHVTEDGDQFIPGNYNFEWFEEDGTVIPVSTPGINTLGPGNYTLKVTNDTTKCANLTPIEFEIKDATEVPVVATSSLIDNINCTGVTPDGEITLEINGGANPADYSINWYEDAARTMALGTTIPATITGAQAADLPGGSYYVEVIDNTNFIGCATGGKMVLEDDLAVISVARTDINLKSNIICDPAFALYTGQAEVINVTEDGNKVGTGNYNFEWLDANENSVAGPSATNVLPNLGPGTYYVKAINQNTNCVNKVPTEFVIDDETKKPLIELTNFGLPTRCETINAEGYLRVMADNSINTTDYNFEWFDGDPAGGGVQVEANNFEITGLDASEYYVIATNKATGCQETESYVLETDVKKVKVNISSQPVTFCDQDNGEIFANVAGGNHYSYTWYEGSGTTGTALYNQATVAGVSSGEYTVVAVDNKDTFCESVPQTIYVEELKTYPTITAQVDQQLTNCDITNPNGAATAFVNDLTKVDFYWYAGLDTTAAHISNDPAVRGLELGSYKVVVVNKTTQCAASTVVTIDDATVIPDTPAIDVVNHDFSCVDPNGMLTGHIDGRTSGYEFHWYDGSEATGTALAESPGYRGLGVGKYTVVAVNEKTGCRSLPATAAIEDDRQYPEYHFRIENATCETPTGAAYIVLHENQTYNNFTWNVNGRTVEAPFIADVAAGDYEVTVTGRGDCPTIKTATIGTEIHAFNGFSPNGDGENEYFHIACIASFQNNNVKIYNRAGQLVYEENGYNNRDVRFEGNGNRGIYLTSNQLPVGTYFYIVDRGDGKKPSSGYLELVR